MKRFCALILGILAMISPALCLAQFANTAPNQRQTTFSPLMLIQTISLAGVGGALDHMAIDIRQQRLFVPAAQHRMRNCTPQTNRLPRPIVHPAVLVPPRTLV